MFFRNSARSLAKDRALFDIAMQTKINIKHNKPQCANKKATHDKS